MASQPHHHPETQDEPIKNGTLAVNGAGSTLTLGGNVLSSSFGATAGTGAAVGQAAGTGVAAGTGTLDVSGSADVSILGSVSLAGGASLPAVDATGAIEIGGSAKATLKNNRFRSVSLSTVMVRTRRDKPCHDGKGKKCRPTRLFLSVA